MSSLILILFCFESRNVRGHELLSIGWVREYRGDVQIRTKAVSALMLAKRTKCLGVRRAGHHALPEIHRTYTDRCSTPTGNFDLSGGQNKITQIKPDFCRCLRPIYQKTYKYKKNLKSVDFSGLIVFCYLIKTNLLKLVVVV